MDKEMNEKLLQAKHRMEEAQARNRKKADKERTHRLIQMGAILGSIYQEAWTMHLEDLKTELHKKLSANITN